VGTLRVMLLEYDPPFPNWSISKKFFRKKNLWNSEVFIYKNIIMKKRVIRLTESDLMRLVKRVIEEDRYGSFGNMKRKDHRGDSWVRDDDMPVSDDEELFGIGDDEEFDTEEFDDFESYSKKYPEHDEKSPKWFKGGMGKTMFNTYREKTGKPFKVKTRRK